MQEGHLNVVKFLVEKGANVHHEDNEGATPLWVASQVRFFLTSKLNLLMFDTGRPFESCRISVRERRFH